MSRALPLLPPRSHRPRQPVAEILPPRQSMMIPPAGRPTQGTFMDRGDGEDRTSWTVSKSLGSPFLGSYGSTTAWNVTASAGQRVSRDASLAASVSLGMLQTNPHIASIVLAKLAHVLGTGLVLSAKVDAIACGMTEDQARDVSAQAERLFKAWAANPRECDWMGQLPLSQQAAAGFVNYLQAGELLAIVDAAEVPDARTLTKVRMLDSTMLDRTKNNTMAGGSVIQGVEFSKPGRIVAYHIRDVSPGAPLETVMAKRVAATTAWGRPKVIHAFNALLPLQIRGLSPLTPALTSANEKEQLGHYTLTQALVGTAVVSTIYSDEAPGSAASNLNADTTIYPVSGTMPAPPYAPANRVEHYEKNEVSLEPGKTTFLARGDKYALHTAPTNPQFKVLDDSLGRRASKAIGLSAEDVDGNYSSVNMSAARMSSELPYRNTLRDRDNILLPFYKGVYRAFLEEQIERGFIRLPRNAKPFLDAVDGYCNAKWLGPGRMQPDIKKYAEATILLIENGLLTVSDALAEAGQDFEENVAQRKREKASLTEAGLVGWVPVPGTTSTQTRKEEITEEDDK